MVQIKKSLFHDNPQQQQQQQQHEPGSLLDLWPTATGKKTNYCPTCFPVFSAHFGRCMSRDLDPNSLLQSGHSRNFGGRAEAAEGFTMVAFASGKKTTSCCFKAKILTAAILPAQRQRISWRTSFVNYLGWHFVLLFPRLLVRPSEFPCPLSPV